MESYSFAREFADTWGLLALVAVFVGVVLWVMRPGAEEEYRDSADIPLRNDKPAPDHGAARQNAKQEARS